MKNMKNGLLHKINLTLLIISISLNFYFLYKYSLYKSGVVEMFELSLDGREPVNVTGFSYRIGDWKINNYKTSNENSIYAMELISKDNISLFAKSNDFNSLDVYVSGGADNPYLMLYRDDVDNYKLYVASNRKNTNGRYFILSKDGVFDVK